MTIYTVVFKFYDTPQSDIQTYCDIVASSENMAVELAIEQLKADYPSDALKNYRVECISQSRS